MTALPASAQRFQAPASHSGFVDALRGFALVGVCVVNMTFYDTAVRGMTVPPAGVAHPAGSWNHARLLVEGGRIRQWLNGTPTADVSYGDEAWRKRVAGSKFAKMAQFGSFSSGVIGLQDHGEPVAFRNIKIRRIGASATGAAR